jgi:hypothetical protein
VCVHGFNRNRVMMELLLLWLLAEGRPWQRPAVNVAVWLHTGQASWASTSHRVSPSEVAPASCLPVCKQTATHSVGPLLPRPTLVLPLLLLLLLLLLLAEAW